MFGLVEELGLGINHYLLKYSSHIQFMVIGRAGLFKLYVCSCHSSICVLCMCVPVQFRYVPMPFGVCTQVRGYPRH